MKTRREYKTEGLFAFKKFTNRFVLICLIYTLIMFAITLLNNQFTPLEINQFFDFINITDAVKIEKLTTTVLVFQYIFLLVATAANMLFSITGTYGFMKMAEYGANGIEPSYSSLFSAFEDNATFRRVLLTGILKDLIIFGWSLITFGIMGIVASYQYVASDYLLIEEPELSPVEVLKKSKEMMRGYKGDLFILGLSYFGEYLLCFITLGIYSLWLTPKVTLTEYCYFRDLNAQSPRNVEVHVVE